MSDERSRVGDALAAIPPDLDRETWWKLACAVYAILGEEGHRVWDSWSRTGETYNASVANSTWRSAAKPGRIGPGTLFYQARQHGWTGSSSSVRETGLLVGSGQSLPSAPVAPPDDSRARAEAARIMQQVTTGTHPYLKRKGFPDQQGLVLGDYLIVPMRRGRDLVSVQRIQDDGTKRFLKHSQVSGAVHYVRRRESPVLRVYTEGLATALSVDAAMQILKLRADVVITFSAGNFPKAIRAGQRGCRQFIVADHDAPAKNRQYGAGEHHARQTGLPWWQPEQEGWDANDVHLKWGLGVLASALRAAL